MLSDSFWTAVGLLSDGYVLRVQGPSHSLLGLPITVVLLSDGFTVAVGRVSDRDDGGCRVADESMGSPEGCSRTGHHSP